MGDVARSTRRIFSFSLLGAILGGCGTIPFITSKTPRGLGPRQTLDAYFSSLASNQTSVAEGLMTASFRARLGRQELQDLLHSVRAVKITDAVDAVSWANQLGARLPSPPPDRREFLLTLDVDPTAAGRDTWSDGTNRRFVDLVLQNGQWRIDAIAVSPGPLITGRDGSAHDQTTFVVPISPLRLGPVTVDRAIYTARQDSVAHGAIPWAVDPVEVVHHDGPSFGLDPGDPARVLGRDVDPSSLVPRVSVVVHQGADAFLVTLVQPIRAGAGGVWAIADVTRYLAKSGGS
ncbi:MAG: hypothetical protein ACRDIY_12280 [Chloroflexota bacterium]